MLAAFSASAEQLVTPDEDPVAAAPLRIGVLGIDPQISITNFGVDTNVFNEVSGAKSDVTFTATPAAELWLRTGRGLISLHGTADLVYFNEYKSERSLNSYAMGRYELRLNRLRPYFSASTLNTRQRPGYEIDVRARHYETDFHAGSDVRFMSKSAIRLDLRHLMYSFAGDQLFNGHALNEELNRTLQSATLSWRQQLTVLTTWSTSFVSESERFRFDDTRNADSLRVMSGFELGRFALIRGSVFLGYRRMSAADGGEIPDFSGPIANVDVAYTAPSQTRLSALITRDLQYSYDNATPYYVQTGWTATLTQRVIGRWDVQVSGGRDRLSYKTTAASPQATRTDFVGRFGGGVGYAVGDQVRFSFDVSSFYRSSDLAGRDYGAIRSGLSVSYGY